MNKYDLMQYILLNEPVFDYNGKQYSVCHTNGVFGTWDSDGNQLDFYDIDSLLSNWMIGKKPFKDVVDAVFPS